MSDTTGTTTPDANEQTAGTEEATEAPPTEGAEQAEVTDAEAGSEGEEPEADPKDDEGDPLSDADKDAIIRQLRDENAARRVELRESRERLKEAKTVEEFEAAVDELTKANQALEAQLLRSEVVRKTGLPEALTARLQGATEEELLADAKSLKSLFSIGGRDSDNDPSGGLDPTDPIEGEFDAEAYAQKLRARRY